MARAFVSGSSEYLQVDSTPITAYPFAVSAWFQVTGGNDQAVWWMGDKDSTSQYWSMMAWMSNDSSLAVVSRAGGGFTTGTSTAITAGVWAHGCIVFTSATSRTVYLNAGGAATQVDNSTPVGADRIGISGFQDFSPGVYLWGPASEVAMWNVVLAPVEVWQLAQGRPPWEIHRANLMGFWLPFGDRTDRDYSGRGYHMAAFNTPTFSSDPPEVVRLWRA